MIKVVRGNPTPEELAAALAVVRARAAATAAAAGEGAPLPPEGWSDPARIARMRRPVPGPRSWARTYWPL
ncbi:MULTISPECIES: acyl-CoA carboxylase epsilon subunit [Streptomyces]|uniref:Acyl-CoA carboxylase epsilon subunit n=1 Tax=Streptomyces chengmaiensis TaxID=3040919 RepID=A0ABT6HU61_9ACTN|nr:MULTISPECIES: acyl-CoA carboxylase epsilon subunit [Streptomyces]MDH2391900.1 acyl-CoA carboxylase epsilon subunit [Streptomyces chengmaiensis]WRQ81721.1 acyl-CoA carboxylase epsilon subunit [Streptomyces sp. MUM 178J]